MRHLELLASGHLGAEYDAWLIEIKNGDRLMALFVSGNRDEEVFADPMAYTDDPPRAKTQTYELHIREDTVILVVGDHGEELFDNGYLGHGVSLSYDSYATLGKLVNSPWKTPVGPVGVSDVSTVFYNSLVRERDTALPVDPEVLCYVGNADKPPQIGLASPAGLIRYDFKENAWTRQARWGAPLLPVEPDNHVIHVWESYVIKRIKEAGGADQPLRGR